MTETPTFGRYAEIPYDKHFILEELNHDRPWHA